MKVIRMTEEQHQRLLELLEETQDEGPPGEGWKSDELCQLIELARAADSGPEIRMENPDAPVDERKWLLNLDGSSLTVTVVSDLGVARDAVTIERIGARINGPGMEE